MLYDFHVFFELLPAQQNCLVPREQELKTFKGFSCLGGLFDFSQNLVPWYPENTFYLFCPYFGVMSDLSFLAVLVISCSDL